MSKSSKAAARLNTISKVLGDRPAYNNKYCIDRCNRTWKISQKHTGSILDGVNHEAHIPYWTSYFIELPGLRFTGAEEVVVRELGREKPTLLEELLRLSVQDGDLIRDEHNGLLWIVKVSEYGLSLDGYDDNHWLPSRSLGVLGFGELVRLSTKEQRDARRREHRT